MLAESWGGAAQRPRRLAETSGRAGQFVVAENGVRQVLEIVAEEQVRVLGEIGGRADGRGRNAARLCFVDGLRDGLCQEELGSDAVDQIPVLLADGQITEHLILNYLVARPFGKRDELVGLNGWRSRSSRRNTRRRRFRPPPPEPGRCAIAPLYPNWETMNRMLAVASNIETSMR